MRTYATLGKLAVKTKVTASMTTTSSSATTTHGTNDNKFIIGDDHTRHQ